MKHEWYPAAGGKLISDLWLAQPLKVALLKVTYAPNPDTHKVWADIAAQELAAAGGYAAGGQVIATKTVNYDAANDRTNLLAVDNVWNAATFDTAYAAVYDSSGAMPLWSLVDFEGIKSVVNGVFTIDWAAIGVLYVTKV